jgi:hypothetical protein
VTRIAQPLLSERPRSPRGTTTSRGHC